MPFPPVKKVIYKKSPLESVVCQLRFAPILKIDTEIPATFQEQIRTLYPNLSQSMEWAVETSIVKEDFFPDQALKQLFQSPGIKSYEFSSEDKNWKINLSRQTLSLTTNNYTRWEEFNERLQLPIEALIKSYSPSSFSRIGLRYTDVIARSKLGLENVDWDELIQPFLLGIKALPKYKNKAIIPYRQVRV